MYLPDARSWLYQPPVVKLCRARPRLYRSSFSRVLILEIISKIDTLLDRFKKSATFCTFLDFVCLLCSSVFPLVVMKSNQDFVTFSRKMLDCECRHFGLRHVRGSWLLGQQLAMNYSDEDSPPAEGLSMVERIDAPLDASIVDEIKEWGERHMPGLNKEDQGQRYSALGERLVEQFAYHAKLAWKVAKWIEKLSPASGGANPKGSGNLLHSVFAEQLVLSFDPKPL